MRSLTVKKRSCFILALLFLSVFTIQAQEYQPIKSIQANGAMIATDYLSNLYVITNYRLTLYDENGSPQKVFEDFSKGRISSIDVSDPMKILVYYQDYMHLKVLDKTLSEIGSYDLNQFGFYSINALAHSRDDNFWIYDNVAFRLKKVDASGKELYSSENFNLLFKEQVQVSMMLDYENFVYLLDSKNGIYVFDRFGTYKQRIPILGLNHFQIIQGIIVYQQGNSLFSYNLSSLFEEEMALPEWVEVVDCQLRNKKVFIVEPDRVSIYSFQ
jgi:hypothetical protein